MSEEYLLGIDIGTYESKGVLAGTDGRVREVSMKPHDLLIPRQGWAEQDADKDWWGDFCFLCRELLSTSGISAGSILAVGVSTIGPCVVPVGRDGKPLRNAILYGIDTRSTYEIEELQKTLGKDAIFNRCRNDLSSQAAGAKILWIKNHEPDTYREAVMFAPGTSYLVWKLTGNWRIDHYTASTFVPLYDMELQSWGEDLCQGIVSLGKLPEIGWTCQMAGGISPSAARETGLMEGTPVTIGTVDAAAEAISVGVSKPGRMMLMYGSTAFMILPTPEPVRDRRVWSAPFLLPGTHAVMAGMATTGALTRWFRDHLARDLVAQERETGEAAFSLLSQEAAWIPPGAEGVLVLPYFSGERTPIHDPAACGVIFGLAIYHTRAHLYRAVLEAMGYGIRHHLQVFGELGVAIGSVHAVGGGVKNELWVQLVSDIGSVVQQIPQVTLGASYGDAFLAGVGLGVFPSLEAIDRWVQPDRTVRPNPQHSAVYLRQYRRYRELYLRTRELMHEEG